VHSPAAGSFDGLFAEAERQLAVCNSCRYCAGYCPVWPELELRTVLSTGDLTYLANLCHDCQDCFTACMYTAPHEFDLNPPKVFAQIREETYRRYAWPRRLPRRFSGWVGVSLALLGTFLVLGLLSYLSTGRLLSASPEPGSPYRILPYALLLVVVSAPAVWSVGVLGWAAIRYWHAIHGRFADLLRVRAWPVTVVQSVHLLHMRGGGAGCDYPGPAPGAARRRFHLAMVYGFGLCVLSTVAAAVEQDVLGLLPPYPYLSVPVLCGTAGGFGMLAGGAGLLVLKARSDVTRSSPSTRHADYGFVWALLVLAASGLLTLVLRDRAVFGPVLLVHLSAVVVAFGIAPYTKFVHGIYRMLAVYKNNVDAAAGATATDRN
jgi:citrate/tricarballylate utilization protein